LSTHTVLTYPVYVRLSTQLTPGAGAPAR